MHAQMASENDTDNTTGSPARDGTDPTFPGPIGPPSKRDPGSNKNGSDPRAKADGAEPDASAIAAEALRKSREAATVPGDPKLPGDQGGFILPSARPTASASDLAKAGAAAARASVKPTPAPSSVAPTSKAPNPIAAKSAPPPGHTAPAAKAPDGKPKARSESIELLIDGLGSEGYLPPKPKTPASGSLVAGGDVQSAPPRKPVAVEPVKTPLPSVLVREDSGSVDVDLSPGRQSESTVITPARRRSRAMLWVAGIMGVLFALLLLIVVRQLTRGDDTSIAPAATGDGKRNATAAISSQPATTTAGIASVPMASSAVQATAEVPSAAASSPSVPAVSSSLASSPNTPVHPRTGSSVTPPTVKSAAVAPSATSGLGDFRNKIQQ